MKDSADTDVVNISKATSKKTGVKAGKRTAAEVRSEANDELVEAESDFVTGLQKLSDSFGEVQKVLQPVIDLFDYLGNEDLSKFFQTGSNALSAASNTASGLNALGLGSASPYGAAIAAGVSLISSAFAMHDEAIKEEIEASKARQKEMQNLTKNLETSLERAIAGIYDFENTSNGKYSREIFEKDTKWFIDAYNEYLEAASKYDEAREKAKDTVIATGTYNNPAQYELQKIKNTIKDYEYISEEAIEALKKAYDSGKYFDQQYASLLIQRDELTKQLQGEQDLKNKDEERIADLKQEIKEIEDEIHYFVEDMAKALYDIDFKSWAQDLADALVSAWASGENAAEAYKKKVSEILKELGVKMIAERFIAQALEPIMERFMAQYQSDNGVLTTQGLAILAEMYDAGAELQKQTNDFMDGINEIAKQRGIDLKETSKSSSTTATIKGITEETADLLASYVNAIRATSALNNVMLSTHLPVISTNIQKVSILAETQVTLQQQIAANTLRNADAAELIYKLLKGNVDGTYQFRIK